MAVKYVSGGGGLFSNLLPTLLNLGGAAIGGPAGAAIGSGLGTAINGGSLGDVATAGVTGYLGANKGINGSFKNPDVFSGNALMGSAPSTGSPFSGWAANQPSWYDLSKQYGIGG